MNQPNKSGFNNDIQYSMDENSAPRNANEALTSEIERNKLPGCLNTQQISENFKKERYIEITAKELIIFIIFAVALWHAIFSISGHDDYYYQYIISKIYKETQFKCGNSTEVITMTEVRTMEQFWCFMSNFLIASFQWKYWYGRRDMVATTSDEDGSILFNNFVIGVPRIRQVRVTNQSCEIHAEFEQKFKHCYGFYSTSTEDREPVTPANAGQPGASTCWAYSTPEELKTHSYSGNLATYSGGGYYLDLTLDEATDGSLITILKKNLWLSRATRAVFIDFTTYNANTNSLCFIKLVFEFPPTGGVFSSNDFHLLSINKFYTDMKQYGWFVLLCQVLIIIFTIYFIIEEINELKVLKCKLYFLSWWTMIDLAIIMLLLLSIIGQITLCILVGNTLKNKMNQKLSDMKSYESFDTLILCHHIHNSILAWTIFLTFFKFLRLLKIIRFMRNLYEVIFEASKFILAFAILFIVIIFACGVIAHLQFGDKVYGLHTLSNACSSLVLALVGHFDLQVLIEFDPFIGSTFCYFYIFLVFFIVTNLIIAILNERFWIKHRLLNRGTDENVWEPVWLKLQKCMYKLGCKRCASAWYQHEQSKKSEEKYDELKTELKRKTDLTEEELDDFLESANVTKKNAANIPNDRLQRLIKDASRGAQSDGDLTNRIEQLENEIERIKKKLNK